GNSCATTGSPTGSSNLMTTSSITVALPGTSSSICRGKSYPSEPETGPIGHDQRGPGISECLEAISDQAGSGDLGVFVVEDGVPLLLMLLRKPSYLRADRA